MKAWRELLGVTVFAVGVGAVCAQNAPVLGNIEAPYAALQGSVMLASTTWGPGAVAYGPIGTPLVLTGHDLGFSGTVQFIPYKNGVVDTDPNVSPVPATVTMWTSNMLILTVPSSAMTGLVKVTTDGLTSNGLPFLVTSNTPYAGICPANPASTQLQITTASLHDGNAGQAYSATLGATGGKTAYTWSITSGTLPAGLSLNATSGLISGTPTTASGLVDLTFEVTDSSSPNQRDQAVLSLGIVSPSIASTTPVTVYDFCVPGPWNSNTNPSCGTTPSGYDAVGNLKSYSDTAYDGTAVVDSVMGTWSFTYDTLNRMITGTGTPLAGSSSGQNYCWAYDSFGNRTVQVIQTAACPTLPAVPAGAITFTSKNQVPNTVTGTSAVSYDAAGNALSAVTSIGQTYYSYDAEGRICAMQSTPISGMNVAYGYLYDANDTRVAKGSITPVSNPATQSLSCDPTQNGFQFTENYVLGPSGEELTQFSVANGVTTWQRTNVYATGKLLATYDLVNNPLYVDGGSQPTQVAALHFHPTDPLGTRRMQLAGNLPGNSAGLAPLGQPETDIQSLPFGDQLSSFPDQYATNTSDDSTPLHFTGKERDTESGNDYFGARYYSSAMGRFMSPDWDEQAVPIPYADLPNPQSLNLYSYVRNNPMSRADADGHCDDDGGKHGTLWCIAHAIGLVESNTERSQRIENERAWMLRNLGHKDGSPLTDAERNAISGASQDQIDKFHWELAVKLTADDIKAGAASLAGVLTTPMATSAAKSLGFRRVNVDWDTHGQAVYEKDGRYISPDKDAHSGGVWKEFDRQGNRVGTLDANLNKIGK